MHDRNTVASNTTADSSTTLGRPACKQFSLLFNRVRGAVHPVCTLSSGIGPAFAYQHILCGVCTPIMIFIYLGGGRSQLWLTLLGLAVTLILNSGFLSNQSAGPAEVRNPCLKRYPYCYTTLHHRLAVTQAHFVS